MALRVVQFALDLAVLAGLTWGALLVVGRLGPSGSPGAAAASLLMVLAVLALSLLASAWYWVLHPARHGGRTFAMAVLGLRVVAADGSPATRGQLAMRWLMLLPDACLFGAVALVAMLVTPRQQRLGDLVADTLVQRSR